MSLELRACPTEIGKNNKPASVVLTLPVWAGIHGRGQHEAGWKGQRHRSAGDRNRAIFERLAENFQHVAGKFGQLVEKE
jgi:hypothetical protein